MSLILLFEENSTALFEKSSAYYYHEKVNKDLIVHTSRKGEGEINPLIDQLRPNESEKVKSYRQKHERQITGAYFKKFLTKCSRIIEQSNLVTDSLSEKLDDWLESRPFRYLGEDLEYEDFLLDVILRRGLGQSPNDLLVAFPYNTQNIEEPPSKMDLSEPIGIKPIVISFKNIRHLDDESFIIYAGTKIILRGKDQVEEKYYLGADEENWYEFIPYYQKDEKGAWRLKYEMSLWYKHDTGESLVNFLPGERSESWDTTIKYKESHIKGFFDFAADALHAYSDNLIVRLRYSYPIASIKPTKCFNKNCQDGYINRDRKNECDVCHGTGYVTYPSPSGLLIEDENDLDSDGKSGDIIKYYTPDLKFAEHSFDAPFKYLQEGKQVIGLDLLDGTGNESGKAKDLRLEDLHDILLKIAVSLYSCSDRFLYQVESLLEPTVKSRVRPQTLLPKKLDIKSLTDLKEEAEESLPENRIHSHREYYRAKYRNEPYLMRLHELAIEYTPAFVTPERELQLYLAKDIIKTNDIIRRLYAIAALESIDEEVLMKDDPDKEKIFELADEYLINRGLLVDPAEAEVPQADFGAEDPTQGGGDPIQNPATDASSEDVVILLMAGKIDRETAIAQIAEIEQVSTSEIDQILQSEGL